MARGSIYCRLIVVVDPAFGIICSTFYKRQFEGYVRSIGEKQGIEMEMWRY